MPRRIVYRVINFFHVSLLLVPIVDLFYNCTVVLYIVLFIEDIERRGTKDVKLDFSKEEDRGFFFQVNFNN